MNTLTVTLVTLLADPNPKPDDVKAGWTAFVVFLLLLAAVALLGWSLSRQLKKAERNKEAGILPSAKDQRRQAQQAQQAQQPGQPGQPGQPEGHAPQR